MLFLVYVPNSLNDANVTLILKNRFYYCGRRIFSILPTRLRQYLKWGLPTTFRWLCHVGYVMSPVPNDLMLLGVKELKRSQQSVFTLLGITTTKEHLKRTFFLGAIESLLLNSSAFNIGKHLKLKPHRDSHLI